MECPAPPAQPSGLPAAHAGGRALPWSNHLTAGPVAALQPPHRSALLHFHDNRSGQLPPARQKRSGLPAGHGGRVLIQAALAGTSLDHPATAREDSNLSRRKPRAGYFRASAGFYPV